LTAAAIFDMDGLLLESEDSWTVAETELFARYGKPFGLDEKRALLGNAGDALGRILERMLEQPGRGRELGDEVLALVLEQVRVAGVEPMPGAADLVEELRGSIPIAVASNSPRALVDLALARARLDQGWGATVCGDEVERLKPAPDVYLEACRRLGVAPEDAVALEDSPTGVASARAAGLFVIGIPSVPGVALEADLVAGSLTDRPVREALGLGGGRSRADDFVV
jgi:HAD superfamily hydrolase (TIGR01509 family)